MNSPTPNVILWFMEPCVRRRQGERGTWRCNAPDTGDPPDGQQVLYHQVLSLDAWWQSPAGLHLPPGYGHLVHNTSQQSRKKEAHLIDKVMYYTKFILFRAAPREGKHCPFTEGLVFNLGEISSLNGSNSRGMVTTCLDVRNNGLEETAPIHESRGSVNKATFM